MVLDDNNGMFIFNPQNKDENNVSVRDEKLISKIEELSKIRKSISLELKQIAVATKISTHQLKNIEGLRFEKLPPQPMRNAFIEQYCSVIQNSKKKYQTTS